MLAKQAFLKTDDVPDGWSSSSVDFVNSLLQRKPANRLGLNGGSEVKSHPWLVDFAWKDLNEHKLKAPFMPSVYGILNDVAR